MATQAPAKSLTISEIDQINQSEVFTKHMGSFAYPKGAHLLERTKALEEWIGKRTALGTWPYSRSLMTAPLSTTTLATPNQPSVQGINFGSQDYLGLSSHPKIHAAVVEALTQYGPHAASSPMLQGNTSLSKKLERSLSDFLQTENILLFPTGWSAGFGAIAGLVRPNDHIVIDQLAHACLMQGTRAATNKHWLFKHNDIESVRKRLRNIRAKDTENSILVVTEGIFSMDSDCPDIFSLQGVCREYDAVLMVDVAHDLGASGPGGTGRIGIQNMLGEVDLVMGSFSKTFSSNGGFLATHSSSVKHFLSIYGGPHIFSNALSPIQAAVVDKALEIVRSEEGDQLREAAMTNILRLRHAFEERGIECLGEPSNVVPVTVGDEVVAKWTSMFLEKNGLLSNLVEFPAVERGKARFRFQVMATHTHEQVDHAVEVFSYSLTQAKQMIS
jgi:7-keto-8-aminopelargonate synthetase-like enzyme